jgi:predicted amidophosphoribosyltransferase
MIKCVRRTNRRIHWQRIRHSKVPINDKGWQPLDNHYCSKCSYPLVPSAFEEIKLEEDNKILSLNEKYEKEMKEMREEWKEGIKNTLKNLIKSFP